jgi:hypothetical protein
MTLGLFAIVLGTVFAVTAEGGLGTGTGWAEQSPGLCLEVSPKPEGRNTEHTIRSTKLLLNLRLDNTPTGSLQLFGG